jgi:WD40 repeat protein
MLRHSEVNFTPDGKSIATLDGKNTFRLWSLDGTLLTTFIIDHEKIKSISLSPDGKLIASGGEDKAIKIWDRDGNLVSTLVGHNGSITSVKFSPNGKVLASASEDQTIRLWSIDLNRPTIMKGNGAGIKDIDLDDNGNLVVSVSHDKTTKLENLDQTFSKTLSQGEESNHLASTVVNAIISPDNQLIAYSNYDGKVKIRTIEGNFLQDIDINNEGLASSYGFGLDFSPDSNILASSTDPYSSPWTKDLDLPKPQILFWKRRGAKFVLERRDIYSEVYEHITKIMFSPDGKVLGTHGINIGGAAGPLYTADEVIELWQLSDGQLLTRLTGSVINFSSDGKSILTGGSGGRIFVWDKGRNWNQEIDLQMTLTGHEAGITALDFSPDNQLIASASQDGTVRLWLEDGTPVTTLIGHNNSPVNDVQFTPDGKAIVSAGEDGNIVLWNFDLDSLLVRGCYWLEDYLANNPNVKDSDRELCEDIISKVRP